MVAIIVLDTGLELKKLDLLVPTDQIWELCFLMRRSEKRQMKKWIL